MNLTHKPGDPSEASTSICAGPLQTDSLLLLQGPDSAGFLQGQTTANFKDVEALSVLWGAFCDVKGRIIADFLALVIEGDKILLRVSADLSVPLQEHLAKYLMFSKAELTPLAVPPWGILGTDRLEALGVTAPVPSGKATIAGGGWLVNLQHGAALWLPNLEEDGVPAGVQAAAPEVFEPAWALNNIDRGEVRVVANISGRYLPQDLSYDLAGWVSFDKGCYTGQEIIARLHWRGTAKRRLYRGSVVGTQPQVGVSLWEVEDTRAIGSIVAVAGDSADCRVLLETTNKQAGSTLRIADTTVEVTVADTPAFAETEGH